MSVAEEKPIITPKTLLAIAVRRRWVILTGFIVGWAVMLTVAWVLPSRYRSETLILVEQQKVPEQYVVPNVASDLQDRLQSMTEQILSRTRLQEIISNFNLYPGERRHADIDTLVERMRNDIKIELVRSADKTGELSAFKVSYSAPTAQLAQQITGQLTSLFIEENLRTRASLSEQTTAFLDNQVQEAGSTLAEQERKLQQFKSEHMGELPEQLQSNIQILSGLQTRLQQATDALHQAEQQKLYLDSLTTQYDSLRGTSGPDTQGQVRIAPGATKTDEKIEQLRADLEKASARYTPSHPDVIRLKQELAAAEKQEAAAQQPLAKSPDRRARPATSIAEMQAMSPYMQLQGQLQANRLEIENRQAEIKQLQSQIEHYQQRLNLTPVREQQLTALTRGYEQSKTNYQSLLAKKQQSELATNLEKRQQGQQFRMIDPPSLPQKPYFPNRGMISLAAVAIGLLLGFGLAAMLEFLHPRVHSEQELRDLMAMPVLVGIPRVQSIEEQKTVRRRHIIEAVAAAALLILVPAATLITYLKA